GEKRGETDGGRSERVSHARAPGASGLERRAPRGRVSGPRDFGTVSSIEHPNRSLRRSSLAAIASRRILTVNALLAYASRLRRWPARIARGDEHETSIRGLKHALGVARIGARGLLGRAVRRRRDFRASLRSDRWLDRAAHVVGRSGSARTLAARGRRHADAAPRGTRESSLPDRRGISGGARRSVGLGGRL